MVLIGLVCDAGSCWFDTGSCWFDYLLWYGLWLIISVYFWWFGVGVWLLLVGAAIVCCIWFVMLLLIADWFVFACCRCFDVVALCWFAFVVCD